MDNMITGVVAILLSTLLILASWRAYSRDQLALAIGLLMLGGLVLRVYTSMDFFLHDWDERFHALVSKNLIKHPLVPTLYDDALVPYDFKNWNSNHVWLHKQPMALWTMALSMWIFGVNVIALRLPSILLSTIGINLTFHIGKYFFDKKVGFLAAFLYAINGIIIELAAGRVSTDHIDIFYLFYIELAIFFSIRFVQTTKTKFNILAGISIGAAILSKWLPALIVLPIWLLIVIDSGKFRWQVILLQFALLVIITGLVFLPWQVYIFQAFPKEAAYEFDMTNMHFNSVVESQTAPFYYFLERIRIDYGELIYIPLGWYLFRIFKEGFSIKRLVLLLWFVIPMIFFTIARTKMPSYILFTAPALFIITAAFWDMLFSYRVRQKQKWLINLALAVMLFIPIRYAIERIKPFDNIDRSPAWVSEIKKLNDLKIKNGVLFNYRRPIEAMFYTDLTVYVQTPPKQVLIDLINKGHTVMIDEAGGIPEDFRNVDGLQILNLNAPP